MEKDRNNSYKSRLVKMNEFSESRFAKMNEFTKKANTEELEALAIIKCEPTWEMNGKQYMLFESCEEHIKIIEKALTPPTEKEVCDELDKTWKIDRDDTGLHFIYDKKSNEFRMVDIDNKVYRYISFKRSNGDELTFTDLKVKDIIILGRFYAAMKEETK